MMMFFRPIPATAANLIETSQLRRRYYSAQVYAQTQRALFIPVTLILRWDDCSTRPVRVKAQDRWLKVLSKAGDETPPISQLRAVSEAYLYRKTQ
ncbi:unnamed protein product, partial [Brenthis ino]